MAWLLRSCQGIAQDAPPSRPAWSRDLAERSTGNQSSEGAASSAHDAAHSGETAALRRILVVDDDPLVRRTLALFLNRAGFAVVAVEGGMEALDLLQTAGGTFDLLVTDQSMPGMTGRELIDAARELCPKLLALLVSGYDMSGSAEQLPADVLFLCKPFERGVFLDQVHALLGFLENEGSKGV